MKNKIKLWLRRCAAALRLTTRRWLTRQLIKLADLAEERLHCWQVSLRESLRKAAPEQNDLASHAVSVKQSSASYKDGESENLQLSGSVGRRRISFLQWEARKSGVAVITKKEARRRRERITASAFDRRFAT